MILETNTCYRTRDGNKVCIFRKENNRFFGCIYTPDYKYWRDGIYVWNENGKYRPDLDCFDLIEEWYDTDYKFSDKTIFSRLQSIAAALRGLEREIDEIVAYCERGS